MLDHLIASQTFGNKINDLGIREEVDTFIFEVFYRFTSTLKTNIIFWAFKEM